MRALDTSTRPCSLVSPGSHDTSVLRLPDLLVPQTCSALSLPSWVFICVFFSSRNGLPLRLLLVNPNLIQIKCHIPLEAFGWVPCTASQLHWTLEQHPFELHRSTYTGMFSHKYELLYYMICGCSTLDTGGLTVKLYLNCQWGQHS